MKENAYTPKKKCTNFKSGIWPIGSNTNTGLTQTNLTPTAPLQKEGTGIFFFFFFLGVWWWGVWGVGGRSECLSLMHSEPSYDPFNSISFRYESWTREKSTFGLLLGKWNKKKWIKLLGIKFESIIQESLKKLTPLWNIIFFF